jgi:DNA-binding NtrC family response regulator
MDELAGREGSVDGAPVVQSEALKNVYQRAGRISRASLNVLIHGEPGVGKKTLARWIHAHSPRASKPFGSIMCEAPEGLLTEEILGRSPLATYGPKVGLFEHASEAGVPQ